MMRIEGGHDSSLTKNSLDLTCKYELLDIGISVCSKNS